MGDSFVSIHRSLYKISQQLAKLEDKKISLLAEKARLEMEAQLATVDADNEIDAVDEYIVKYIGATKKELRDRLKTLQGKPKIGGRRDEIDAIQALLA